MLRFHVPLIEPDVRISRIRLSDKVHVMRFAHGRLRVRRMRPDKTERLVEVLVGKSRSSPCHAMLAGTSH